MNDETLRQRLQTIDGEDPSPEFLGRLRSSLDGETIEPTPVDGADTVTVLDLRPRLPETGRRLLWPLAGAAALLVGLVLALQTVAGDRELGTATGTEAEQVGEAWLQSIVDNDRGRFASLHADDLTADDTLMGFSEDTEVLTPARISELYLDGFDALQAALDADADVIRSNGCRPLEDDQVRCAFTATMVGGPEYTYTLVAVLTVSDGLIDSIDFSTMTDPPDFRDAIQDFLDQEATDEDRACLALGFNTIGCGRHESDFVDRYAAFYEAMRTDADDG